MSNFVVVPGVRAMVNDDGGVLLNIDSGKCYSLNPIGAAIWTELAKGLTTEQLLDQLAGVFSVSRQQLAKDVTGFLQGLEKLGMVTADPGPTAAQNESKKHNVPSNGESSVVSASFTARVPFKLHFFNIAVAYLALITADVVSKVGGFRKFHGVVKRWRIRGRAPAEEVVMPVILSAIETAAHYYFKRVLCLQRAGVTACMLRSFGIPAEFVIACRKYPFYAHAWVEVHGVVVNDAQAVQEAFATLDRF